MILRVDKAEFDGDRVPVLIYWKTQKTKQQFVTELAAIENFKHFTKIEGVTAVKVEAGVFKPASAVIAIRFADREEKSSYLRRLWELGDDSNMQVSCPDDIPYNVISSWINKSLTEMGIKPNTPIDITD